MDEPEVQLAEQAKINNSQHDLKSGREKPETGTRSMSGANPATEDYAHPSSEKR